MVALVEHRCDKLVQTKYTNTVAYDNEYVMHLQLPKKLFQKFRKMFFFFAVCLLFGMNQLEEMVLYDVYPNDHVHGKTVDK